MSYVLTLKLSFLETVVLCKALGLYVGVRNDDEPEDDRVKAKAMLREVESALARGPVSPTAASLLRAPSAVDQRRCAGGNDAPCDNVLSRRRGKPGSGGQPQHSRSDRQ